MAYVATCPKPGNWVINGAPLDRPHKIARVRTKARKNEWSKLQTWESIESVVRQIEIEIDKATGFVEAFRKIEQTQDDWNGYGSKAPSKAAISTSRALVLAMCMTNLRPDRVVRSAAGGVFIYIKANGRFANVEVFNEGEIVAELEAHPSSHIWTFVPEELPDTLARIHGFFAGE